LLVEKRYIDINLPSTLSQPPSQNDRSEDPASTEPPVVGYRGVEALRMKSYLTLVPRGLQDVVREILLNKALKAYRVEVELVGERVSIEDVRQMEEKLSTKLQKARKRSHQQACSSMILSSAGTLERGTSLGYMEEKRAVWAVSGQLPGVVWLQFTTDAPPSVVGKIRCIGPLLAIVHVREDTGLEESQSLDQAVAALKETV